MNQERLWRQCKRSLDRQGDDLAPSASSLLHQVVGAGGQAAGYLYGGFTTFLGLRALLAYLGREPDSFDSILDFGCGSARVIRWFADLAGQVRLAATDISPEAIAWSKDNVDYVEFGVNEAFPPLPMADDSFDLVFGISVMTHLDEGYQAAWLRELARLVRPGGLVLLSVHGDLAARQNLSEEDHDRFDAEGLIFERSDDASVEGLPDFYQATYHSRSYLERVWTGFFDLELIVSHGPMYRQELVVMSPRSDGATRRSRPRQISLPLGTLDDPRPGAVRGPEIELSGWAFHPRGEAFELLLWLDGQLVPAEARWSPRHPELAGIFLTDYSGMAGFSIKTEAPDLSPGLHALWLTEDEIGFPLFGTYFRVG